MGSFEFPAWDPVLLDLPGPIDLRWYGLMYVVGFVAGQFILNRLARAGFLAIPPDQTVDLVFHCIIGTIVGGRVGYSLFYQPELLGGWQFFAIWGGGLSFHGGFLGVMVAIALFARRRGLSIGRVLDAGALAVTPGILAVRCANFINGELYGRVTTGDTFGAMRFPTDELAVRPLGIDVLQMVGASNRAKELQIQHVHGRVDWQRVASELEPGQLSDAQAARLQSIRWDEVADAIPFRHPSQLYEGLGEGLLLGLVMLGVYLATRRRPLLPWTYGALFTFGYGLVRIAIENLRQPDSQFRDEGDDLGTVLSGLTMGQVLCIAMVVAGLAVGGVQFKRWLAQRGRPAVPQETGG